jgi:hypothetical protein
MFSKFAEELKNILAQRTEEDSYDPFVTVNLSAEAGIQELSIEGTPDGLLYLASECMRIAATSKEWEHAHIDGGNIADRDGIPLVLKRLQK